ncbi:F-box only protein 21 [Camponotus floridanus]|uniref:F-box only protein 21 n=1 Tax=Camponotus floridanus TaxID=104421 RepID=E2AEX5_CAMFO|nr:F-box only protein 21 [Camponotus floridanus]
MATLIHMPAEIISKILEYKDITIKDIVNFSSTSKQFRYIIINDNTLWKKKFSQRWPIATQNYERKMGKNVQAAVKCTTELWNFVSDMSKRHYYYSRDHEYLDDFFSLFEKRCLDVMHCTFLKDELIKIIYTSPEHYLERKVKKFKENLNHLTEEEVLTVILQLCQPEKYISYLRIDKFIDNIVQEVLKGLREEYPSHKIFLISPEQLAIWRYNNIEENYWDESQAKQIKGILDKIILNFDSYNLNYPWKSDEIREGYLWQLQNRKNLWLTIYCCMARRLGIYIELSMHYECQYDSIHIAWKSKNHKEYKEYFYIDWKYKSNLAISVMNKCDLMPNPKKISLSELMVALEKDFEDDIPTQLSFLRLTYEYINSDVRKCTPFAEKHWKQRSNNLKFAVGMVVIHRHRGRENQTGVIIGWHTKFQPHWLYNINMYGSVDL